MSVNKVILIGYVGRDPSIRYVGARQIAEIALATNEPMRRTATGEEVPSQTEWHRVVMFDTNAEIAEKYIRKGTRIYVEGKLRTRMWEDRNAIKHSVTEIYVDTLELLSRTQDQ